MEKKSQDFSIKEAQRLAGTPEGQRLMQLLQQQDAAQLRKMQIMRKTVSCCCKKAS